MPSTTLACLWLKTIVKIETFEFSMNKNLFELFSEMIDCISPYRIPYAVKIAHERLEDDLLHKRIPESIESDSILNFCQFIQAVLEGDIFFPVEVPITHVVFYQKVVWRLVEAGIFTRLAKVQFDANFSEIHLNSLSGQHAIYASLLPNAEPDSVGSLVRK
jgi:hypothetical protein